MRSSSYTRGSCDKGAPTRGLPRPVSVGGSVEHVLYFSPVARAQEERSVLFLLVMTFQGTQMGGMGGAVPAGWWDDEA